MRWICGTKAGTCTNWLVHSRSVLVQDPPILVHSRSTLVHGTTTLFDFTLIQVSGADSTGRIIAQMCVKRKGDSGQFNDRMSQDAREIDD